MTDVVCGLHAWPAVERDCQTPSRQAGKHQVMSMCHHIISMPRSSGATGGGSLSAWRTNFGIIDPGRGVAIRRLGFLLLAPTH